MADEVLEAAEKAQMRDDGGPAFPRPIGNNGANHGREVSTDFKGMTLRDYFAGQALIGILSSKFRDMVANVPESCRYDLVATDAFLIADAMLKERSK